MSRLETVQRKYTELLAEMKRTEREHIKSKKRADQLQKEKDNTRSELSKMTSQKERLEKLCREMQKDNKKLKDENRRLLETEVKMREELHERLEGMVLDVQELREQKESPESTPANIETDELFRHKFKSFIDQYELREIQFHSLLRTKELEVQYQMARYEQQRKAQEQEANKTRQLTSQVATFSQTETELRSQLNIYVEKFKQVRPSTLARRTAHSLNQLYQVEDTLNNSNELFMTFRREMEEMSKKTKRLEKENHNLTRKHELTSSNILQMAEDRQKAAKELELLKKKNENLEKLCRGMQAQGRGGAVMQHAQQQARLAQQQAAAQQQQRAAPPLPNGAQGGPHNGLVDSLDEGTESDYEYDEDDELDENSDLGEYDEDDTEEESHAVLHQAGAAGTVGTQSSQPPKNLPQGQRALPTFGPSPPPPPQAQKPAPLASGKGAQDGNKEKGKQSVLNGVKH